jgi:hypothetical protein
MLPDTPKKSIPVNARTKGISLFALDLLRGRSEIRVKYTVTKGRSEVMIIDGIEYCPVTNDPEKLARLYECWDNVAGVDSAGLAEFALTLGLTPPGYEEGAELPDIIQIGIEERHLVWDIFETDEVDIDEGRPGYEDDSKSESVLDIDTDHDKIKIVDVSMYPIFCHDCSDMVDKKAIKYDNRYYLYCPDCALNNEMIDYDLRDKLI